MIEVTGNIWDYHKKGHWIVITTNGTVKKNGEAVMGRGVAKQATVKFPMLSKWCGDLLIKTGLQVFICPEWRIITLPVKYDWWEKADLELIGSRLDDVAKVVGGIIDGIVKMNFKIKAPVYLVRPGCGNGGLDWKDVKPVCEKYLDDRFVVVDYEK